MPSAVLVGSTTSPDERMAIMLAALSTAVFAADQLLDTSIVEFTAEYAYNPSVGSLVQIVETVSECGCIEPEFIGHDCEPDGAEVVERHYASGRPFWTVECNTCGEVLNSGHHYLEPHLGKAHSLADSHNVEFHSVLTDADIPTTCRQTDGCCCSECMGSTQSRTATIIAEMRAADSEHAARNAECPPTARKERPGLATATGRKNAAEAATILLSAFPLDRVMNTDLGVTRNNIRREHSLPRRAMSIAASRGKVRPDMLTSLMAYFSNPADMASAMLASFLPTKIITQQAAVLLSDPFVVDVIEGLGVAVPTPKEAVKMCHNYVAKSTHGAPGRVRIYKPGVPATVDPVRRGRPSGPKYVDYLPPIDERPTYTVRYVGGIPGGNDVAQGAGRDQGAGWDLPTYGAQVSAPEYGPAWYAPSTMGGGEYRAARTLTPAQQDRFNAALSAVKYHPASVGE